MYDDASLDDTTAPSTGQSMGEQMLDFGEQDQNSAANPSQQYPASGSNRVGSVPQRQILKPEVKIVERPPRQITEIRVYFDDLTYESFVPKK